MPFWIELNPTFSTELKLSSVKKDDTFLCSFTLEPWDFPLYHIVIFFFCALFQLMYVCLRFNHTWNLPLCLHPTFSTELKLNSVKKRWHLPLAFTVQPWDFPLYHIVIFFFHALFHLMYVSLRFNHTWRLFCYFVFNYL